jgi:hypothetical protein
MRMISRDNDVADGNRHASFAKTRHELCGWRTRQGFFFTSRRVIKQDAIFGHDPLKDIVTWKYGEKVIEFTTGDKDQFSVRG